MKKQAAAAAKKKGKDDAKSAAKAGVPAKTGVPSKKVAPKAGTIEVAKKPSKAKKSGVGAKKLAEASKRDQFLELLTEDSPIAGADRLQKLTDALLASPSYAVTSFTCTACFEEKDTGAGASMTCAHWMCFPCIYHPITTPQAAVPFALIPSSCCLPHRLGRFLNI